MLIRKLQQELWILHHMLHFSAVDFRKVLRVPKQSIFCSIHMHCELGGNKNVEHLGTTTVTSLLTGC